MSLSVYPHHLQAVFICVVTVGYTGPYDELVPKSPQISLLSFSPIFSMLIQMAINISVQLVIWFVVQEQPW